MPNRWLKADILSSDRWNGVPDAAQSLYVRVLLVADDHGRFDGRVSVIESACYPLKTIARNCAQMLAELEQVDLIRGYLDEKGRPFLVIPRFYERPRSKSRFPAPPEGLLEKQECTHLFADAYKCEHLTSTSITTATATTTVPKAGTATPKKTKPEGGKKDKPEVKTTPVWQSFAEAYRVRYGTEPTRNSTENAAMARFITLVPFEDAPSIAAFYVRHNKAWYVSHQHSVKFLMQDAAGLRTQWLAGQSTTETEARQTDRTAATGNAFAPLIAEAEARERIGDASK